MDLRRVVAEVAREATRPSTFRLLGAHLVCAALLALAADEELALYWNVLYVFLPLLMAPLAARVAVRDRERGTAAVLETTPLTRAEALAAKVAFLALFLLAALALAIPSTMLALTNAGPDALALNAHRFTWALLLGAAAAGAGLLVGALALARNTVAVSAGFLVIVLWVVVAEAAPEWTALADSPGSRDVVLALVHASPVAWAYDALQPSTYGITVADGSPSPMWGALVLAPALLALAALVALRLQNVDDWARPLRARGTALAAVAVVLLASSGAVASWDFDADGRATDFTWRSADGRIAVTVQSLSRPEFGDAFRTFEAGETLRLRMRVVTPQVETVTFTALRIDSPYLDLEPLGAPPHVAEVKDRGPGGRWGPLEADFRVTPRYVGGFLPFVVTFTADGERGSVEGFTVSRPADAPTAAAFSAAAAPAAVLFIAARTLPRRLNDW